MYCFHSERARVTLRDIGPAVWNGGFSTFLAVVLLVFSKSYVSMTFFKVSSYIDRTKYGSSNGSASEIINCQNWNYRQCCLHLAKALHKAGAYSGFRTTQSLAAVATHPGLDASLLQGNPPPPHLVTCPNSSVLYSFIHLQWKEVLRD